MTGPRSGSADATLAPAFNDNARPATAAASRVSDRVTISENLPTNAPPKARRRQHQRTVENCHQWVWPDPSHHGLDRCCLTFLRCLGLALPRLHRPCRACGTNNRCPWPRCYGAEFPSLPAHFVARCRRMGWVQGGKEGGNSWASTTTATTTAARL